MKELKFKAKRLDNGEWETSYNLLRDKHHVFFGSVPYYNEQKELCLDHYVEVDPKTLCQFTGLLDVKKVEIYSNDLLEVTEPNILNGTPPSGFSILSSEFTYRVFFKNCRYFLSKGRNNKLKKNFNPLLIWYNGLVVVGNQFDKN